jgi:hypothetical protein
MNSLTDPGVAALLKRPHQYQPQSRTEYSVWVDTTSEEVPES